MILHPFSRLETRRNDCAGLLVCDKEENRADIHVEKPLLLSIIFFIMLSNLLSFFCMVIAPSRLKITASQWTMSSQNDVLTKSMLVVLTGHTDCYMYS